MIKKDVFIVGVKSIFPKYYSSIEIVDIVYSEKLSSIKINKLAKRLISNMQVKGRAVSINLDLFPLKIILNNNSPLVWAKNIILDFVEDIKENTINFLSISYNTSSHTVVIPNLACQVANECKLKLNFPPQEIAYYGCAAGIFSIKSAVDFCQYNNSLASIFAFEQSSWISKPIYDDQDINFKASLRTNALFGDGGAGLLLASGNKADNFDKKLKIIDIHVDFEFGDVIKMEDGLFLTRDGVKDVMPKLVSDKVIKPLLQRNNLQVQDVPEWSIHQGGIPILESFMQEDILGLTQEQIEMSKKMFIEYGNVSTPSSFIVFEQHFNSNKAKACDYGMIVGFGAGYYLGAVLYQHC